MDGECCIGDLGFALKLDSTMNSALEVNLHSDRVGTKRYMAPEVLDNTIRLTSPEAFKQADMYSLGLVFWEVTRRCYVHNLFGPDEYQLPYQVSHLCVLFSSFILFHVRLYLSKLSKYIHC
ncbi:unnamed protein product [Trichobilharzia regenti]|nr:unnamed protein product [Trichobilharzia regenti]